MQHLKGYQKTYLRGLAHHIKPTVFIGQNGLSQSVVAAVDEALEAHELIKLKFLDFKEKDQKQALIQTIEDQTGSELVGMIGHMAVFFRRHQDPKKQKIKMPTRQKSDRK